MKELSIFVDESGDFGEWGQIYNPDFNSIEFDRVKAESKVKEEK